MIEPASCPIEYSVILPVYNEAGNVPGLIAEIDRTMQTLAPARFEILAIDDASTDHSATILQDCAATCASLRVYRHRRNLGQSAALVTGFRQARGTWVITLDADGQNDPADIPRLLEALGDDVDAVCGVRAQRHDTWIRRISSRWANAYRNAITGDHLRDAGCGFRVIRRSALSDVPIFNGLHRFLPTLLRYQGLRVAECPIRHRPRQWGASKYGIRNRLFRGILDCMAMRWWARRALPLHRLEEKTS